MRKILTILMLLALTVPAWAGEKTITISRNEGEYEVSNGVYTITKGGVQLVMTGGMNNPNYLLMMQQTTMTFLSNNYKIKKIVFHCMDNTENTNLDCFFWGPTTLSVQKNISHNETPGSYTAPYQGNSYDGCWVSSPTYSEGLPTSYELMFKNEGKPVRFASIDVVIEKDQGDIYDLVTSTEELKGGQTYVLVSQHASRALSNGSLVDGPIPSGGSNYRTQTYASTPITWPLGENNKNKVKTTDNVQFITLGQSDSNNRPWVLKVGENFIRRQSGKDHQSTAEGNRGWDIYNEDYSTNYPEYFRVSIALGYEHNALIRYYLNNSETSNDVSGKTYTYAIRHYNSGNYFRFINYEESTNSYANNQRVFLYKPSINYRVLTGCNPEENAPGYITLGDGVLDISGVDYSQYGETVTFFVGQQNGYQIESINVYTVTLDDNGNITSQTLLYSGLTPTSTTTTGSNYSFTMPESHVYVEANFTLPTYYGITTVCNPTDGGAITMTGGVTEYNNIIEATAGSSVTFTVSANEGFLFNNVVITDSNGDNVNYTYDETTGTYTYVMPATPVTITANFKQKLIISTACEPSNGGYFEQNTMTCNGQSTNFYYGAQYYADDVMTFMVKTNYGYRINKVIVTDAFGMETTLTPTETYGDGNFYSFSMPNSNVTITAYFYNTVSDLYLLGTANHGKWMTSNGGWLSYGPKFNYNPDTETYSLDVYFTGTEHDDDGFGYFSLTKVIDETGNWGISAEYRLVADQNNTYIADDDNNATKSLYSGNERNPDNAFKIPAGVYTITVNKAMNQITVKEWPFNLTFDPAGGTAESPVVVSDGTVVTMSSALYDAIYSINPDDAVNVAYKHSVDGTNYTNGNTTTLNKGDENEILVTINGDNYLGHIEVPGVATYKVMDTPLHWIEEFGEKDKTYTVSDRLQGVYAQGGHLWCKDLGDISIVKTEPNTDQVDYLAKTLKTAGHIFADNMRIGNWDQSNWVELDFTSLGQQDGNTAASALVNKYIKAGTVTGVYSDDVNYTITLTAAPEADGDTTYVPNTYCTANFLEGNLKIGNNVGPTVNGTTYYFLNPKIQEYAIITYAMWDKDNRIMVIPGSDPFNGAACIGRWDLNNFGDQLSALDAAYDEKPTLEYEFHIIVQRENKSYGSPINASKADTPLKPDQTASAVIRTQPLDLQASSGLPTAITTIGTEAQVVGVEYVNIAGMRSSKPWQGINIVVTRYSDGSTTTTKVVK